MSSSLALTLVLYLVAYLQIPGEFAFNQARNDTDITSNVLLCLHHSGEQLIGNWTGVADRLSGCYMLPVKHVSALPGTAEGRPACDAPVRPCCSSFP